jgi:trimeric autotransporter adhesin
MQLNKLSAAITGLFFSLNVNATVLPAPTPYDANLPNYVYGLATASGVPTAAIYVSAIYTDSQLVDFLSNEITPALSSTLGQSNAYTDGQVSAGYNSAVAYTNAVGNNTLTSANGYTNGQVAAAIGYTNTVGSNTLTSANGYTNTKTAALGNSTASTIGGGSAYNPATGTISSPTISVGGANYNNVTGAIQALDTKTNNLGVKNDGSLASVASSLGGGSTYNPVTGAVSRPTYTVGGTNYNDVGSALNGTLTAANTLGNSTAASFGGGSAYNLATGAISNPTIAVAGTTYSNTTDAVQALDSHAVKYDNNAAGTPDYSNVTLGTIGTTATIHNVTAGVAGTDAVNVNQLAGLGSKNDGSLASVSSSFGGGSVYNPVTGAFSQPTYAVGGTNYNDVGAALNGTLTETNNYTNTKANDVLTSANNYTKSQVFDSSATVLGAAKGYTNVKTSVLGDSTSSAFGGGSVYNPVTGAISNPTIAVAGTTYSNTTDAVQALDSHAVKYDNNAAGIPDYSNVTLGTTGTTATIHNVTAGVAGTDAANIQQVTDAQNNAISAANAYTNGQVNNLGSKTQAQISSLASQNQAQFKTLSNQIKATGSIASAMSALIPNLHSASNIQAQAAVGYGSGAAAIGGGMTYQINNDTLLVGKLAVSTTSGVGMQNRIGGAVGISLGL